MSEFDLIAKIKAQTARDEQAGVILGIGDDCALLAPPAEMQIALSTDTLVSGVHFFPDVDPVDLGYKALAVNLSDLAAMGAKPLWCSLNLTLPTADPEFVQQFMQGYLELAKQYNVALIGGDTTRGPLNIAVTVLGSVDACRALKRSAAQAGDLIFVSGSLGAAACAVQRRLDGAPEIAELSARLNRPQARVELGLALLGRAQCAIDISDGLAAELSHICRASGVGARIECAQIPIHPALSAHTLPSEALEFALSGGDDYELCFTAPADQLAEILKLSTELGVNISVIGEITTSSGISFNLSDGALYTPAKVGFQHFAETNQAF